MFLNNAFARPLGAQHGDEGLQDVTPAILKTEAEERRDVMLMHRTPEDAECVINNTLVLDAIDHLVWELAANEQVNCDNVMQAIGTLKARVNDQIDELCG